MKDQGPRLALLAAKGRGGRSTRARSHLLLLCGWETRSTLAKMPYNPVMRFLLLLLFLSGQEDQARHLQELISKLSDDSIEVRSAAVERLAWLGKEVIPVLEGARKGAAEEVRGRLSEAIEKIRSRDALLSKFRPPSLISVYAKDRPLREVFRDLAMQCSTPLDYSRVPEDAKVTISLSQVPFWAALDDICKASGKARVEEEGVGVRIAGPRYIQLPFKRVSGPLAVWQTGHSQQGGEPRGVRFRATWEKGTLPSGLFYQLVEMKDGKETDVPQPIREEEDTEGPFVRGDKIFRDFGIQVGSVPTGDAEKLTRFKVVVRFVFVLEHAGVVFKDPEGKGPMTDRCEKFSVELKECKREDRGVSVSFNIRPQNIEPALFGVGRITFKDGEDQEHLIGKLDSSYDPASPSPIGCFMRSDRLARPVAAVKEVSFRVPSKVHTERIEIPLKELKFK